MQRAPPAQAAEGIEHEHRYIGIEGGAVFGDAVKLAVHGARGGAQAAAAGVFEAFAGLEIRLFAHHAVPFDFFMYAIGIVDIPGARDELGGDVASVGDGDGVGEAKHAPIRRGLVGQILRAGGDGEMWARHNVMVTRCVESRALVKLRFQGDSQILNEDLRYTLYIAIGKTGAMRRRDNVRQAPKRRCNGWRLSLSQNRPTGPINSPMPPSVPRMTGRLVKA